MVAIGGLNAENLQEVLQTGVDGVALVSAIFGREDINDAAATLATLLKNHYFNNHAKSDYRK